ncbi:putative orfan [Tupanvirus soda lake]|uniref:Orfan n=2 Tax=Tupanvirus TaxID=2094720 RepID=A0AC62AB69_9VIRU|nr:putative orfan [Tupanvirus soda lake]QKU35032.1 putative orfan [Tupanvirus soda lake]
MENLIKYCKNKNNGTLLIYSSKNFNEACNIFSQTKIPKKYRSNKNRWNILLKHNKLYNIYLMPNDIAKNKVTDFFDPFGTSSILKYVY